jgi:hypothetical protein
MKTISILAAAGAAAILCAGSALAQGQSGVRQSTQPSTANANGAANAAHVRLTPEGMRGAAQTGQPGAECGSASAPNTPGHAANAQGSPFNPSGNAGTHYAGEQPQNSRNTASVSQYDSACAHQRPH